MFLAHYYEVNNFISCFCIFIKLIVILYNLDFNCICFFFSLKYRLIWPCIQLFYTPCAKSKKHRMQHMFWKNAFILNDLGRKLALFFCQKQHSFSGFMKWTYARIQYHLSHWGMFPSSWKSYFTRWHFLSKNEKTLNLP